MAPSVVGATLLPPLTVPGNWTLAQLAVRSAIMFAAGAVMYQWKDVIPARWSLVAVSAVIVLLALSGLAHLQPAALFFVATVAALPLAAASWFLIEKPSLSLKRRLKRKWSGALDATGGRQTPTAPA